MKKVKERTNIDLLELTLQLYARSLNQPRNKGMHNACLEARQELEKRLSVKNNGDLPNVIFSEAEVCEFEDNHSRIKLLFGAKFCFKCGKNIEQT